MITSTINKVDIFPCKSQWNTAYCLLKHVNQYLEKENWKLSLVEYCSLKTRFLGVRSAEKIYDLHCSPRRILSVQRIYNIALPSSELSLQSDVGHSSSAGCGTRDSNTAVLPIQRKFFSLLRRPLLYPYHSVSNAVKNRSAGNNNYRRFCLRWIGVPVRRSHLISWWYIIISQRAVHCSAVEPVTNVKRSSQQQKKSETHIDSQKIDFTHCSFRRRFGFHEL